jgi:hypothetical protein
MPRKRRPHDIVNPNLRIREDLRMRIETEAKKNGTSINKEMNRRLFESFDRKPLLTISEIAVKMESAWKQHDEQI